MADYRHGDPGHTRAEGPEEHAAELASALIEAAVEGQQNRPAIFGGAFTSAAEFIDIRRIPQTSRLVNFNLTDGEQAELAVQYGAQAMSRHIALDRSSETSTAPPQEFCIARRSGAGAGLGRDVRIT